MWSSVKKPTEIQKHWMNSSKISEHLKKKSAKTPKKTLQKSSPLGSWSKIRYLLHINGRRSPFVR